jgi:predicted permease
VAAIASFPVALATLRGISTFLPEGVDIEEALRLDGTAAAVAFAAGALCAVVFGIVPALNLSRARPAGAMQASGSARAIGGKSAGGVRHTLATAQIALSMLMLVFAALFLQNLANILRVDTGIRSDSLFEFSISPMLNGYTVEQSEQLIDRLEQNIAGEPGVTSVATSVVGLLTFSEFNWNFSVEGHEAQPDVPPFGLVNFGSAGFLQTLGVPVLVGRDFTDGDIAGRPKVAIVSREFASRYGLGDVAVGKRIGNVQDPGSSAPLDIEIVGVMPDIAYSTLKDEARPQVLLPRRQTPGFPSITFYVRTDRDPDDAFVMLRESVAQIDPTLPATSLKTFKRQIEENSSLDRMIATLAATLAAGATLLAALGLYGVLSYTVAERTREIGLRLALGADPRRVRRMVLKRVAWMATIGVPAGLLIALALGRVANSLLFGMKATDPQALVSSLAVVSVVVLGASYLPARRASRVQPVTALRSE